MEERGMKGEGEKSYTEGTEEDGGIIRRAGTGKVYMAGGCG